MSWTCDGVPKNGKTYHGLGGAHTPFKNNSPDCEDCGLPEESSRPPEEKKPIGAIVAGLAAIVIAGGGAYWWTQVRCPSGFERTAGQCEDPHRETYQEAIKKGQDALDSAIKAQDPTKLSEARTALNEAIEQLDGIPEKAAVSREAVNQANVFLDELQHIDTLINEDKAEKTAIELATKAEDLKSLKDASDQLNQVVERLEAVPKTVGISPKIEEKLKALNSKVKEVKQLEAIESLAATAKQNTAEAASSIPELKAVEAEWKKILTQLGEVPDGSFLEAKVQKKRTEYNQELSKVQDRINALVTPPIDPPTPTPTDPDPTYQPTPPSYRPAPPTYRPVPRDPCAVEPKPSTCLF